MLIEGNSQYPYLQLLELERGYQLMAHVFTVLTLAVSSPNG